MLVRQGADGETAEEIAQETMLTVWRKLCQSSNDIGGVTAWTFTIARNLSSGRLRRQAVWQDSSEELDTTKLPQGSAGDTPSWEREQGDIECGLGKLPPEQLQVMQLAFVDGLSRAEIASKLDLPLGMVKLRMRLAFDGLRGSAERAA